MTFSKRTLRPIFVFPILVLAILMFLYLSAGVSNNPSTTTAVAVNWDEPVVVDDHVNHAVAVDRFVVAEERRIEEERIAAGEARRAAEEAERRAAERSTVSAPQQSVSSFDLPSECTGKPIPAHIVMRESRCNYGAVNQTGCSGYTCVGMYQFDLRHWIAKEDGGWGGCAWLGDWRIPENQDACASQMSRNGTNLAPWGG